MTPLARVRLATLDAHAPSTVERHGPRYEEDRAAVAAMLKNYGWLSLLWLLPLSLILFDLLEADGEDLKPKPLGDRRLRLQRLADAIGAEPVPDRASEMAPGPETRLTPWTDDLATAERWFADGSWLGEDGIVAKRVDQPYQPGVRGWIKVKHRRTTDCVL